MKQHKVINNVVVLAENESYHCLDFSNNVVLQKEGERLKILKDSKQELTFIKIKAGDYVRATRGHGDYLTKGKLYKVERINFDFSQHRTFIKCDHGRIDGFNTDITFELVENPALTDILKVGDYVESLKGYFNLTTGKNYRINAIKPNSNKVPVFELVNDSGELQLYHPSYVKEGKKPLGPKVQTGDFIKCIDDYGIKHEIKKGDVKRVYKVENGQVWVSEKHAKRKNGWSLSRFEKTYENPKFDVKPGEYVRCVYSTPRDLVLNKVYKVERLGFTTLKLEGVDLERCYWAFEKAEAPKVPAKKKVTKKSNTIKIGDYVKCMQNSYGFSRGKIYKVSNIKQNILYIEKDDRGSTTNGWGRGFFIPATKEEIELMDFPANDAPKIEGTIEVGDYVKCVRVDERPFPNLKDGAIYLVVRVNGNNGINVERGDYYGDGWYMNRFELVKKGSKPAETKNAEAAKPAEVKEVKESPAKENKFKIGDKVFRHANGDQYIITKIEGDRLFFRGYENVGWFSSEGFSLVEASPADVTDVNGAKLKVGDRVAFKQKYSDEIVYTITRIQDGRLVFKGYEGFGPYFAKDWRLVRFQAGDIVRCIKAEKATLAGNLYIVDNTYDKSFSLKGIAYASDYSNYELVGKTV